MKKHVEEVSCFLLLPSLIGGGKQFLELLFLDAKHPQLLGITPISAHLVFDRLNASNDRVSVPL
jgi:hypothetical protein